MKKIAILVAGGEGRRMGAELPKQFILLRDKPILWYSLNAFLSGYPDMEIILVLPEAHLDRGRAIVEGFSDANRVSITSGGPTRFHSVQNGLRLIKEEAVIFVHDAVRCLVSREIIVNCYEQAMEVGSAIPSIPATDSIRMETETGGSQWIDRTKVRLIQTPQTFTSEILLPAFEQEYQDFFTDEANVVEHYGHPIFLAVGHPDNIKITWPTDLLLAEQIISGRAQL